jgi:hypothetical protein
MKGEHLKKPWLVEYNAAKEIVKAYGIKTYYEYENWPARPRELPANPRITYKKDWEGARLFFETSRPDLQELKEILIENDITTHSKYVSWEGKKKFHLPSNLLPAYGEFGFTTIGELLGKEKPRSFKDQKNWIKNKGLKSSMEFNDWSMRKLRPTFISSRPDRMFKETGEWKGWANFLNAC